MTPAVQIFSRDFDADFFKLPKDLQDRIENRIDRLGLNLENSSHKRLTGLTAFRLRVGDYRVIYKFDLARGELFLIGIGHPGGTEGSGGTEGQGEQRGRGNRGVKSFHLSFDR